jgi:hypothetical protein
MGGNLLWIRCVLGKILHILQQVVFHNHDEISGFWYLCRSLLIYWRHQWSKTVSYITFSIKRLKKMNKNSTFLFRLQCCLVTMSPVIERPEWGSSSIYSLPFLLQMVFIPYWSIWRCLVMINSFLLIKDLNRLVS